MPDGRFVIASDDNGAIAAAAQPLLAQIPIGYVTSKDAGWTRGLLRPSYLRFAPRVGLAWSIGMQHTVVNAGCGIFLNQWAYSVQQALAQTLPFFFAKTVNAASDAVQPTYSTENMLLAPANGTIGGSTMDHDYRTEYAKNVTVGIQRQLAPTMAIDVGYLGSWVVGADSSTVLNVPEPGPGPIGPRRPVPQLSNVTAIRWDGYSFVPRALRQGRAAALARRVVRRELHVVDGARRRVGSRCDDVYETNLPQNVRDMAAEDAPASFDHRHRVVANATYALPDIAGGRAGWMAALGGWRVSAIVDAAVGRAVHGQPRHRPRQHRLRTGPAARCSCAIPTTERPAPPAQWFDTACFALPAAVHVRQRRTQQRACAGLRRSSTSSSAKTSG